MSNSTRSHSAGERTPAPEDRRVSKRIQAHGPVTLVLVEFNSAPITGELVDVSNEGFRAKHDCTMLTSGQVVEFKMAERSGRARTAWSRIAVGGCESGFYIVA